MKLFLLALLSTIVVLAACSSPEPVDAPVTAPAEASVTEPEAVENELDTSEIDQIEQDLELLDI